MYHHVIRLFVIPLVLLGSLAQAAEQKYETIHAAAQAGDLAAISTFLQDSKNLNLQNGSGQTPLLVALQNGRKKAALLLIKKGADIKIKDYSKRSSLYWAIMGKLPSLAKILLDQGVDPNDKDFTGQSVLRWAAVVGDLKTVNLLLKKGADPKDYTNFIYSPIYCAAEQGHIKVVKRLLPLYPPNAYVLAFFAKPKAVEKALKANKLGYNTPLKGNKQTVLHCAAEGNNAKLVAYLIKKGVDLNRINHYDQTALHIAAAKDHAKIVAMLLKAGALLHLKSNIGETALDMARKAKSKKSVALIEKRKKQLQAWFDAAAAGDMDTVKKFQQDKQYLEAQDDRGWTALHYAAAKKQKAVIASLAAAGINMNQINAAGNTALLMALQDKDMDLMAFIAKQPKVDKNRTNKFGLGPLHLAASQGYKEAVDILLNAGVDVNISDMHGNSALDYAQRSKKTEMAAYLKEKGGEPGTGLPPLVLALNEDLAKLFSYLGARASRLNSIALQFTTGNTSMFSINTGRKYSNQAAIYLQLQKQILNMALYLKEQEPGSERSTQVKALGVELNRAFHGIRETYPDFRGIAGRIDTVMDKLIGLRLED